MGHTIHGVMPRNVGDVPEKPCVWCRAPTDLRFIPAGRPDLGVQPMHMLCAADLIRAYEAFLAGRALKPRWVKRMATMPAHPAPALIEAPSVHQ